MQALEIYELAIKEKDNKAKYLLPVWIDQLNEAKDFSKDKLHEKFDQIKHAQILEGFMIYGLHNLELNAFQLISYVQTFLEICEPSQNVDVFLNTAGSPLEILIASKVKSITCIETDYPFFLANKHMALNLDHVFQDVLPFLSLSDFEFATKLEAYFKAVPHTLNLADVKF